MAKSKQLSIEVRSAIITLHNEGKPYREIASKLKISLKGVQTTITRHRATGSLKDRPRSGRPKATTEVEDRNIVITSKRNRRMTAPEIRAQVNQSRPNPVSVTTVKRRLRAAGLHGRVAVRKPLLRKINKQKRLQWALKHRNWTQAQWEKVLWTDESKFEVFGTKRRQYVRRSSSEKMLPECVLPTVKHGGGSIMVWGCFSAKGTGDLIRVEGIMKKVDYLNILQEHAVPSGLKIIGQGFCMQQDNDPKHSSRLCRGFLEQKERRRVLSNMEWPPQSPDLNPIELLWEELDRRVRDSAPTSQSDLWRLLQEAWESLPAITLQKLVDRMPRLVEAVIKSKGGFFDETKV